MDTPRYGARGNPVDWAHSILGNQITELGGHARLMLLVMAATAEHDLHSPEGYTYTPKYELRRTTGLQGWEIDAARKELQEQDLLVAVNAGQWRLPEAAFGNEE